LKILLKDQDLIPEATALCLEYLEQIHFGPKTYLKDLTQTIIKVLDEYSDPEKDAEVFLNHKISHKLSFFFIEFNSISSN